MQTQSAPKDYSVVLRKITISSSKSINSVILSALTGFANQNGFAFRLVPQQSNPAKSFVHLYRSDIKLTGDFDSTSNVLNLNVYSTFLRGIPEANVNKGVGALKEITRLQQGLLFLETKLNIIENNRETMPSFQSLRNAKFNVPRDKYHEIRKLVSEFADKNEFAIRFGKTTPDPDDLTISLYRDNILIVIDTLIPVNKDVNVSCYQLNGTELKSETINQFYKDLKSTVETIEGVKFEYTK